MDDPLNTNVKRCSPAARSRFQAYAAQTSLAGDQSPTESLAQDRSTAILSFTHGQLTTTENSSSQPPHIESLLDPTHSTSAEAIPPQGYPINNHNVPSSGNCPTCGALQSLPVSRKRKHKAGPTPSSKRTLLAESVQSTMAWLKEGIANLSPESFSELTALRDILQSLPKDEADTCRKYLWEWSAEAQNTSGSILWSARFLSACCALVGTAAPSLEPDSQVPS